MKLNKLKFNGRILNIEDAYEGYTIHILKNNNRFEYCYINTDLFKKCNFIQKDILISLGGYYTYNIFGFEIFNITNIWLKK